MKPALRLIPTEVWVDIFCFPWISREKLGRIVDKIGNFEFAECLQFFLHDWGKRTLKEMLLDIFDEKKQPCIIPPQTPMPDNIKFFHSIKIGCFDSTTVDFLRRISTLFTGVNLTFDDLPPQLSTILDHLSPLIHGIHSMSFARCAAIPHMEMEQSFGQKLAQVKMLTLISFNAVQQTTFDFCMNWLTSEEQRGPRLLQLNSYTSPEDFQQFLVAIQQQFHSAKSVSTFAIRFTIWRAPIDDFDLENSLGEQLHGQFIDAHWTFQINRHQPNAGKALQEWVEETDKKSRGSSRLHFLRDLLIGRLDANTGDNGVNVVEEEADDQPSTSGDKQ